jgi:hypothetical protein
VALYHQRPLCARVETLSFGAGQEAGGHPLACGGMLPPAEPERRLLPPYLRNGTRAASAAAAAVTAQAAAAAASSTAAAAAVPSLPAAPTLSLRGLNYGDAEAAALGVLLRRGLHARAVDLRGNRITAAGAGMLLMGLAGKAARSAVQACRQCSASLQAVQCKAASSARDQRQCSDRRQCSA